MSNKQQTAVEWQYIELSKFLTGFSEFTHKSDILIKAKEMEKEQMKNIAVESYYSYTQYLEQLPKIGGATVEMDFEQWYNGTYGGNK
jgi:hypothetical protein